MRLTSGSVAVGVMSQFLYNGTTGALSFDRDGTGTQAVVQIATLAGNPTLVASDFVVATA